ADCTKTTPSQGPNWPTPPSPTIWCTSWQRYQIDPTKVHAKATAQQIVVANLNELQPWLYR
ncbi:hypothetical protein AAIG99_31970, partial [Pseudomonas aeruginosa]